MRVDDTLPQSYSEALDQGWEVLGSGAFRTVFNHPDLPGRVLKIQQYDSYANEREARKFEEVVGTAWEHLFPPVLAYSPDFHAIVMRREPHTEDDSYFWKYPDPDRPFIPDPGPESKYHWKFFAATDTGDAHEGNMAAVMDDYGTLQYTKIIDYAARRL